MIVKWYQQLQGLGRVPVLYEDKVLITIFDRHTKQSSFVVYNQEGTFIWNQTLPAGGYMTPVIGEKTVFVPTRFTKIAGLDKDTGENKWTFDFTTRIRTSPCLYKERLIVPTANKIYHIDENGKSLQMNTYPGLFFYGEPKVKDGYIYVLGNESSDDLVAKQVALCIDAETLEIIWKTEAGEGKVMTCDTAGLEIDESNIYLTNRVGTIYCLERVTGEVLWQYDTNTQNNRSKPIIAKGNIYTNSLEGIITCLSTKTGEEIFTKQLDKEGMYSPIGFTGEHIITHCGVFLYLLNCESGEVIEKTPIGHGPYTQPIVDRENERLYLAAGDPPDYFNLLCFELKRENPELIKVIRQEYHKGDKDSLVVEFQVKTTESDILVDTAILGGTEYYKPIKNGDIYEMNLIIPRYLRYGRYALPITIFNGQYRINDFLYLDLSTEKPNIPKKHIINNFETNFQDSPSFSGGATMKSMLGYWGKDIDIKLIKHVSDYYKQINVDPHHKWRTGAVRMFHASSLPINEESGETRVPGLNLFSENG